MTKFWEKVHNKDRFLILHAMGAKKWKDEKTGVSLTMKEKDFCHYYISGGIKFAGNASACYRKVFGQEEGTTDVTIWRYASDLMKRPQIQEQLRQLSSAVLRDETIISGLESIATDEQAKHADKARAWELLGKIRGMFVDKSEVNIKSDLLFSENDEK